MALSSPDQVLAALADGMPGDLIDTPETAQIDFKESPYLLDTPKGKWELAKDVAGLANLDGGVLVVGVRTTKTEGNFLELASELRPVPGRMLDKDKHHAIIRDLVRPASASFQVAYYPDPDEVDKGYMTIHVKSLSDWDRPAIIRRIVSDNGKFVDAINIPIRDSDQTRWLSGDECYQLLRDGQRANARPNTGSHHPAIIQAIDQDDALERLINHKDWDSPVLAWQSTPATPIDILSRFWGSDGLSATLRRPTSLRSTGFNWYFLSDTTQFENGILASDGRHAVWVREDGSVTAAATIGPDSMLTWATRSSPGESQVLNVIALCELTLEYYRLIDGSINPISKARYTHSIVTRKFSSQPPVILPQGLPGGFSIAGGHRAGRDGRRDFTANLPTDPERDTYEALWRLYTAFQFGQQAVPFITDERFDTQKMMDWIREHQ